VGVVGSLIEGFLRAESDGEGDVVYECAFAEKRNRIKNLAGVKKPVKSSQIHTMITKFTKGESLKQNKQEKSDKMNILKLLWKKKLFNNVTTRVNNRQKSINKRFGTKRVEIDVESYYPALMQIDWQKSKEFQIGIHSKMLTEMNSSVFKTDFKYQGK
jgi:hypothetical protein